MQSLAARPATCDRHLWRTTPDMRRCATFRGFGLAFAPIPHPIRSESRIMPFTLAHPGAVLSLMKGPLVPAALVAGFVTPDVSYVIRVPVSAHSWHRQFLNATDTHAVLSGFTLGLPLAIALLALYWFVRQPVSTLIPPCFRFAPPPAGWPHWGADWSLRNWLALGEHFPSLTCDRQLLARSREQWSHRPVCVPPSLSPQDLIVRNGPRHTWRNRFHTNRIPKTTDKQQHSKCRPNRVRGKQSPIERLAPHTKRHRDLDSNSRPYKWAAHTQP